jgi:hypothetical protein
MVRKAFKPMSGVKGTTQLVERKPKKKHYKTGDSPERVDNCLHCDKPASKCKGNCYGNY